jgi:hypothetical protein
MPTRSSPLTGENAAYGPATVPCWRSVKCPQSPVPVVAQSWRGGGRQALFARLQAGWDVEALDDRQARSVGSLAARAATTDIVDSCVVEGAIRRHDLAVSSDQDDLLAIAAVVSRRLDE